MGKGDKKTKKGKIHIGSFGVTRKRKDAKKIGSESTAAAKEKTKKAPAKKTKKEAAAE